ncbi:hypothetical protein A9Q96_15205 [Rhodobacterales bacterium 52_120_T64]|nr:hypothetical protein A9Q96_15205 [Rhodobacterales bacterium 52_120_T64]
MVSSISYAPLIGWEILVALTALNFVVLAIAAWFGLRGWFMRSLLAAALLGALLNPSYKQEDRNPLSDIVFVVIDETASQTLPARAAQMQAAVPAIMAQLERHADAPLEVITVTVRDTPEDAPAQGTMLMAALADATAQVAHNRIAGAIILGDGRIHDLQTPTDFPAPVHLLQTGRAQDWDRRIVMENAPAFGIVGESLEIKLRIEDTGAVPRRLGPATIFASIDGGAEQQYQIPVGESVTLSLPLQHAGINLLDLRTPAASGEITDRNNRAILPINGVRDRLRVLLVSGEPYAGERTWRNLLRADASVDLVHFTILRPPQKQDGVPVTELSLIAFPTRELFMEKIDDFDLIIFDRYRRRGILPDLYLENVARYVRDGGAILLVTGPAFAEVESLARSPMRAVLPALPTGRVIEEGYLPRLTDVGRQHPVTAGLESVSGDWGRWLRQIDLKPRSGHVAMDGALGKPLLVLDRVERGRIAILASDHAWLWSRGFEGGGPQLELLRRLAHWLMKEPELEEEVLSAAANGKHIKVERRSLGDAVSSLTFIGPSGQRGTADLSPISAGRWHSEFNVEENGIYRISDGTIETVVAVGPASPREFEQAVGVSTELLAMVADTGGGIFQLEEATPDIRRTRLGRVAKGRNWLGLPHRDAYTVEDIRLAPLAPGWLVLLFVAMLSLFAWRYEGR